MRKITLQKIVHFFCCFSWLLAFGLVITGCGSLKSSFDPNQEYPKEKLQEDYHLFRDILQDAHPSLYWYNSKDSLDYYFDYGYRHINDSMTEPQFRTILSYVIAKIDCGHTSIRFSKKYAKYIDTARKAEFPLGIKFWGDSAVVYINTNRQDSILKRGTVITAINNIPIVTVRDSLFRYMVTDGYSIGHKYQTLSNLGTFGGLYQSVFGPVDTFNIRYADSYGTEKNTLVNLYDFRKDTSFRKYLRTLPHQSRKENKIIYSIQEACR
jgi:hypothetical protein